MIRVCGVVLVNIIHRTKGQVSVKEAEKPALLTRVRLNWPISISASFVFASYSSQAKLRHLTSMKTGGTY